MRKDLKVTPVPYRRTLFCAAVVCALLLCAGVFCAFTEGSHAAEKDPYPLSADTIYVEQGRQTYPLNVRKKYPDLVLTYYTEEGETALTVDQDGLVTMLTDLPGTYVVYVHSDETDQAKAYTLTVPVCIPPRDQEVKGPARLDAIFGKQLHLKVTAKTRLTYRSDTKTVATVDDSGTVTFLRPGKATIVAVAEYDGTYLSNCLSITITCRLGTPTLKASKGKRKVKLRWSSVPKAQKYLIYCKYPGKKKYKLVTTQSALVRGITHKHLKKGKKYKYKIRAYLKLNGKEYYSPYSKEVTVKVK